MRWREKEILCTKNRNPEKIIAEKMAKKLNKNFYSCLGFELYAREIKCVCAFVREEKD